MQAPSVRPTVYFYYLYFVRIYCFKFFNELFFRIFSIYIFLWLFFLLLNCFDSFLTRKEKLRSFKLQLWTLEHFTRKYLKQNILDSGEL